MLWSVHILLSAQHFGPNRLKLLKHIRRKLRRSLNNANTGIHWRCLAGIVGLDFLSLVAFVSVGCKFMSCICEDCRASKRYLRAGILNDHREFTRVCHSVVRHCGYMTFLISRVLLLLLFGTPCTCDINLHCNNAF